MGKKPTQDQQILYNQLRSSFKKIEDYTDAELDAVIAVVGDKNPEAYTLLNFVDAYFERRSRRQKAFATR